MWWTSGPRSRESRATPTAPPARPGRSWSRRARGAACATSSAGEPKKEAADARAAGAGKLRDAVQQLANDTESAPSTAAAVEGIDDDAEFTQHIADEANASEREKPDLAEDWAAPGTGTAELDRGRGRAPPPRRTGPAPRRGSATSRAARPRVPPTTGSRLPAHQKKLCDPQGRRHHGHADFERAMASSTGGSPASASRKAGHAGDGQRAVRASPAPASNHAPSRRRRPRLRRRGREGAVLPAGWIRRVGAGRGHRRRRADCTNAWIIAESTRAWGPTSTSCSTPDTSQSLLLAVLEAR